MIVSKPKTAQAAVGRWPGILSRLGIDAKHLQNKHGPCPACGGKDRFRFDDKEGRGTWFCSKCGSGDGIALLRQVFGWSFAQAAGEVDSVLGVVAVGPVVAERDIESKLAAMRKTWSEAQPVRIGDPVSLYLKRRVGVDVVGADIRCHPALPYYDDERRMLGRFPAMLALMRHPGGEVAAIHRTYLTGDGGKAAVPKPKKMMAGKPLNSASVRLSRPSPCLGIAEGIETALAASIRFGLPVWAATSAQLLEDWLPPEGVESVVIAGDCDTSFTGQASAFVLAKKLQTKGYAVRVEIPGEAGNPASGKDWADQ